VSASALLSELRRRDIQLRAEGAELRCSAPAGALTAELTEQLRRYKAELLALLAAAQAAVQARAVVPLQPLGGRTPVFGVPGHNGDVFCYRLLSQALGAEQPFFGLQPPGLDGAGQPLARVEDLAAYFAGEMRAFCAEGACIVAGFCAGGTVAFELARQLARSGVPVRCLALFGCPYPLYFTHRVQLGLRVLEQTKRLRRHARELLGRSAGERRRYLAEELASRRARREGERAAARDPVLARRAKVEGATVAAVRRYRPGRFPGRIDLFMPGPQWRNSGVAQARWRGAAAEVREHFGPDASTGSDMLRERHAAAFAELFRQACEETA
jgi:thioesterase domain-containing protein